MKLAIRCAAFAAASALVLTGCTNSEQDSQGSATAVASSESGSSAAAASKASYPLTVEHKQGSTEITAEPEKIVVLDYSALDYVDTLGLGDKVVAVPSVKAAPAIAENYGDAKKVGSLKEPDMEAIAGLEPDLILLGSRNAATYPEMSKIAPTVDLSFDYKDAIADTKNNAETVAKIFGLEAKADEQVAKIDAKMDEVKKKVTAADKTALVIMTNGGELSAYGTDSRFALVYELGFKPAAEVKMDGRHGEAISFEYVANANPDYIFVVDRDAAVGEEGNTAKATLDNELIKGTKAGKDGNIVYLSSTDWYLVGSGLDTYGKMIDAVGDAVQ
ncbi:siderophore ABC transporter substrate-binding protein [Corynebacterium sp.]|uniref:siderophore ABC transporter substrate-binding protein n=1 Tax=Corynebacterium sp. TaxID=1720 RepID=UPI0026DD409A|nr:ABC transporter substrate-binding protein [Corynebacterium sp.]MDO5075661.1 ABC transporter substrate-binding protein [Corynebacterium sp.]